MLRRRKGFTLIELLVVIAIIGILAAMLFPVFAKARESARKVQCLSNVKNIAMAVQMYLSDWNRFWPREHEKFIIDYFLTAPGGGTLTEWPPGQCLHTTHANPYLRTAVLLDDYIKNRDIWKCPSAKLMNAAKFIVPMGPNGHWWEVYQDNEGKWGTGHWNDAGGPCDPAFPPGWGGDVTNSIVEGREASPQGFYGSMEGHKVFLDGYSVNSDIKDYPTSAIDDPAKFIVLGDGGKQLEAWSITGYAFPDYCQLGYPCCSADWVNCPMTQDCGVDWSMLQLFWTTPQYRKQFTRHMGGSNIGFADGHAKFFLAEELLNGAPPVGDEFEGAENCTPMTKDWQENCACW